MVLALLAVLLLALAVAGVWAQGQIDPGGRRGPLVSVVIPRGASTARIARILSSAGVVHDATLFTLYVRIHGSGPLLPGTYLLDRNSTYGSAISALEAGPRIIVDKLVVPEGFTVRDIAAALGKLPGLHLSASAFVADATDGTVRSPYEPQGVDNLEGLLFPATYDVSQNESEIDVLEQMVGAFDEQAQSLDIVGAAAHLHETPYQLVTVASIVEREAKLDQDRGPVASVIYNRLRAGMPLGADSTETYYLRLTDPTLLPTPAQLDQPGPYNTRINTGLPPTPISNPGIPSLVAASDPPPSDYLYFVEVEPDGQLRFASTEAGFEQLQAQCQAANLC